MGLIRRDELKAYRFGSEIRVKVDDFQEFIENAKINGGKL